MPGQFVGIRAGRTAGRELFVYLNRAGRTGQASVSVVSATLSRGRHPVRVRWVDNSTATVGPYLTGAIIIPVRPMKANASYTASVVVRDGSRHAQTHLELQDRASPPALTADVGRSPRCPRRSAAANRPLRDICCAAR